MSSNNFTDKFMETLGKPAEPEIRSRSLMEQDAIGEYNENVLKGLLEENRTRPVKITHVNVFGTGNNFRSSFLQRQIDPLLSQNEGLTLEEFVKNVDLTTTNFVKTNTIRNIGVSLTMPQTKSGFTSSDTLELVTNLNVLPVKKFLMKVGTNIGNGEGDGYVNMQWKNMFGGGELLNCETNLSSNRLGAKNKSQYLLSFSTPIANSPDFRFDTMAYHSSRLVDFTSYHEEVMTGITNRVSTNYLPPEQKINQEINFENMLRGIGIAYSPNNYRGNSLANDYYILNSGHSLKSCLRYTASYDTRDRPMLASTGKYVKLTAEASLLAGSRYLKNMIEAGTAYPLTETSCVNMNFKAGLLRRVCGDPINPIDKFQFGGPNDVRGFEISGLGPKQMGLSIGGDAYFGCGLSLFNRIPYTPKDTNLKMHSFINTGKMINTNPKTNILQDLTTKVDMSVGLGLVYIHPAARFEINYVLPIIAHRGEDVRSGLQWGIGVSFL